MQLHDRKGAVEQQQDLPREMSGARDTGFLERCAQPGLELLLVRGADLDQ